MTNRTLIDIRSAAIRSGALFCGELDLGLGELMDHVTVSTVLVSNAQRWWHRALTFSPPEWSGPDREPPLPVPAGVVPPRRAFVRSERPAWRAGPQASSTPRRLSGPSSATLLAPVIEPGRSACATGAGSERALAWTNTEPAPPGHRPARPAVRPDAEPCERPDGPGSCRQPSSSTPCRPLCYQYILYYDKSFIPSLGVDIEKTALLPARRPRFADWRRGRACPAWERS